MFANGNRGAVRKGGSGSHGKHQPAACALVTRARRIAEEAGAFREQARGLASGLEAELRIVLDALYPIPQIFDALRAFTEQFPTVPPRLYVASLGAAANLVTDGHAPFSRQINLLPHAFCRLIAVRRWLSSLDD